MNNCTISSKLIKGLKVDQVLNIDAISIYTYATTTVKDKNICSIINLKGPLGMRHVVNFENLINMKLIAY